MLKLSLIRLILFCTALSLTRATFSQIADKHPSEYLMTQLKKVIEKPLLVGTANYSYLFWNVYTASLYAPNGHYSQKWPFALTIKYKRSLSRQSIVNKTLSLIARQIPTLDKTVLMRWQKKLMAIIPDVTHGSVITGIKDKAGNTLFLNTKNQLIGNIQSPQFGHYFFNIWPGKQSTHPEVRKKLLGQQQ